MPDLPSWRLSCSSDLSAGTATSELLVLPNMGVSCDAKIFSDSRSVVGVRCARAFFRSATGRQCRQGGRLDDTHHRPVVGMEERLQSENFTRRQRVVYEVQKTNWEDNAFERNLWIADAATNDSHALTSAKKSSSNAEWSLDGNGSLFFPTAPDKSRTPQKAKNNSTLFRP